MCIYLHRSFSNSHHLYGVRKKTECVMSCFTATCNIYDSRPDISDFSKRAGRTHYCLGRSTCNNSIQACLGCKLNQGLLKYAASMGSCRLTCRNQFYINRCSSGANILKALIMFCENRSNARANTLLCRHLFYVTHGSGRADTLVCGLLFCGKGFCVRAVTLVLRNLWREPL